MKTNYETVSFPASNCIYKKNYCIVRLLKDVNSLSIIKLCDEIDILIDYFQYKEIEIHINSPGGSIDSLLFYTNKLAEWRRNNVVIKTVVLTEASSAAAMILSLGDISNRKAYSTSKLLYHKGRYHTSSGNVLTSNDLSRMNSSLINVDEKLLNLVTDHIYTNYLKDNNITEIKTRDIDPHTNKTKRTKTIHLINNKIKDPKKGYLNALKKLFDKDKIIKPETAKDYFLIDEII